MSKTCKKLLASALAATMLFSTFVSSLVVSAAATGTLEIGTETITVGTESATVDFTLTFSEAVAAPHDLATIVAKNANEETLTITAAELGEVVYVVDGVEQNTPYIDGIAPDDEVEPPSVSVESTNLTAGKILFGSGVASAADVKVINFTVTFDTTTATVGTYTVTATTDGTDYDEADVVVTPVDGAIVVEEPHTCTAGEATDNGNGTHDIACAGNCGKLFADNEACNYVEGICDVCGAKEPVSGPVKLENIKVLHALNLASDLSITFAVTTASVKNYVANGEIYAEIYRDVYTFGANPVKSQSEVVTIKGDLSGSYYKFKYSGIAAREMTSNAYCVIYTKDSNGVEYRTETDVFSVQQWCINSFVNQTTKDYEIAATLAYYGAQAQIYTNYRTDALATGGEMAAYVETHRKNADPSTFKDNKVIDTENGAEVNGVTDWKRALMLTDVLGIKFAAQLNSTYAAKYTDLKMVVTYTSVDTGLVTAEGPLTKQGSMYTYTYYGLKSYEFGTPVTAAIYDGDTLVSSAYSTCPTDWCASAYAAPSASKPNEAELAASIISYNLAAKAYFGK